MKTREQNRNNKRTEIERFDWFIERIQTRVAFGWLSERSGEKNFMPKNFLGFNRWLWLHTATRLTNRTMPSPYYSFLWRENKEAKFGSFHPLADKTNNERFLKLYFSRSYENCSTKRITLLTFAAFDKFLLGLLLRNIMWRKEYRCRTHLKVIGALLKGFFTEKSNW